MIIQVKYFTLNKLRDNMALDNYPFNLNERMLYK